MPYKFASGETEAAAVKRCAGEQLDTAIAELTDNLADDPVQAVHAARKALKKERSLLRLSRDLLSRGERRRMNAALRDTGRRLSAARDAEVMIQAVDDLAGHYAGQLPKKTFNGIKTHLNAQAEITRASLADPAVTGEVIEDLKALRLDVEHWYLTRSGWAALSDGLHRSYERGRKAYRRATRKPTDKNLHEWRKRSKDVWYHLRLLEPAAPGIINGHAKAAHELSDLLGDDHDLAVLRESLERSGGSVPVDVDSVVALIDHRRAQLQTDAFGVGGRLYAEKPKAFARRMRSYWQAWRAQPSEEETHEPVQLPGRHAAAGTA
jgi:CHAD domain-containing protein